MAKTRYYIAESVALKAFVNKAGLWKEQPYYIYTNMRVRMSTRKILLSLLKYTLKGIWLESIQFSCLFSLKIDTPAEIICIYQRSVGRRSQKFEIVPLYQLNW